MRNSLDPSLLDNILKKTNVKYPGTVVLVEISVTLADVSFDTMEQCKRELRMINITDFPGDNSTECFLKIKSLYERLEGSGCWYHNFLVGINNISKGLSEDNFRLWALKNSKNTM